MPPPSRHVRKVCLTAPNDGLIRRGAILLEDALHTASLPELAGSRVLVVRSLHVGKIHSRQSSASLAVAIEKRLWQLHATAVYAVDPTASQAVAVYFRDETEPYCQLASRLARQADVGAWFWALAVPEWQPTLPKAEAFRRILAGIAQTQPGVMAVVALIQELQQQRVIAPLLAALTWQEGTVLLRQGGWQPTNLPISLAEPGSPLKMQSFATWNSVLTEWTAIWGVDDARSLWLAAIVLLADNPARVLDPHLIYRAQQVIKAAQATLSVTASHSSALAPPASSQIHPEVDQSPVVEAEAEPEVNLIESNAVTAEQPTSESSASSGLAAVDDSLGSNPISPTELNSVSLEPADVDASPLLPSVQATASLPEPPALSHTESWDTPRHTKYAGFFFLVTLLNHLNLNEFLEAHPHLIEMEFPQQLLHTIAHRLAIPSHDPIWQALPLCHHTAIQPIEFVVPQSWQYRVYDPKTGLTRLSGTNFQMLCDRSQRLPLALWHDRPPAIVQSWLEKVPASPSLPIPSSPHPALLHTWLTAIRRWCRRYAQMGLLKLVQRPGQLACTRTHLDLLLNHEQADIRIRRVGLDLNPGWVPWLGRVVSFHYLYGER